MPAPRRRRPSYHVEAEITPTPQQASPNWLATLGNVPVTFVLTFIVTAAIFYGVTQYRLGDYDKQLGELKIELKQAGPAMAAKMDGEAQQRTAIRNEFMANANKTIEILGSM